jgi:hypothetical protein
MRPNTQTQAFRSLHRRSKWRRARAHDVPRLRRRVLSEVIQPANISRPERFLARVVSWKLGQLSRSPMRHMRWVGLAACLLPVSAAAQQQQPAEWAKLPQMQLERQYAGPLKDTVIQRWRDPVDGTICYIYLPIRVTHSTPDASGYVQYGANPIGSMSCTAGRDAERPPGTTSRPGAGPGPPTARTSPPPASSPAPAPASPGPPVPLR